MEWTRDSVDEFLSMIEDSSVEQLKSFIEKSGDGHLPFSGPLRSSISHRAIIGCMAKPSEAVEKIKFFVDQGMTQPYGFSIANFVKHDYRGRQLHVENTPEELEAIKGVLRFLSSQGWKFSEEDRRGVELQVNSKTAILAYHADLDFLMLLSKMGLSFDEAFDEAKELDYSIVTLLFENSSIDTLDYLVERGLKLTRYGKCTIASDWTKEFADYLISKDQPVLLEHFASDCNFDVYCHAAEKSGMKCDNPVELWGNVVNSKRFDIGEWLLQKGVPICSEAVHFGIDDMEAMDWALAKGLKFEVDVEYCSRDTLLYAAKHGAKPCGSLKIDTETHRKTLTGRGRTVDSFEGMRAICELFDFELIKAFLDAGFADEADASSAVEAEEQELIDLYASYGVDTTLKVVVDGSEYVRGGVFNGQSYCGGAIATIPEGIEEIRPDAFIDCKFDSVELPETLKVIGSRAFARRWGSVGVKKVVVPKSVASLGYGAFAGFDEIYVYDNIDADAAPAHSRVDENDGSPNGSVGWAGIAPRLSCDSWPCAADVPYRWEHKIIVLSAETGEIKYKVDMPIGDADRAVYCTLVSAWGKNAEFDFSVYKKIFKKLPYKRHKLTAALYRLMWPVNLDEEGREFYEKYVVRYAKDAAELLARMDDLDGFKLLASIGAIKKTNIDHMISSASDAQREGIVEYLESYRAESFPSKRAAAKRAVPSDKATNEKSSKPAAPQIVNERSKQKRVRRRFGSYRDFENPIERTIEVDGLEWSIFYAPARCISQLETSYRTARWVAPVDAFLSAEQRYIDYGGVPHVNPDLRMDQIASRFVIEDFLKVLAVLTDEEMQRRIIAMVPGEKGGDTISGQNVISINMDGLFFSGDSYVVSAKSDAPGSLTFKARRKKISKRDGFGYGAAEFLEENKDIVERLGLGSSADVKGPVNDYAGYKKNIERTVEACGIKSALTYDPAAAIEALEKCLRAGWTVSKGFPDGVEEALKFVLPLGGLLTPEYLADQPTSNAIIESFLKLLALLTDEEMQQRIVDLAPKKKDGNLAAGRIALSIAMDGVFADGGCYAVKIESDKSNRLAYTVIRETYPEWSFGRPSHDTAEFLEKNWDIVERLGLS